MTVCPACGSKEIGKGELVGENVLMPVGKLFNHGSYLTALVCTDCGLIISWRVEEPEKFK